MLLLFVNFVIFTLALTLFLIWSTSPELWNCISFSAYLIDENSSQLLYLIENLLEKATDLIFTGKNLGCSLTCDDMEFALPTAVSTSYWDKETQPPILVKLKNLPSHVGVPVIPEVAPKHTSWLIAGTLLMGLNAHLSQLSPVASF
ncbi:hypothetical protein DSO57_1016060 [Entomophthora muscae]|uniref:Uncharacterized protein n=1 Tax=Entomophthora muscae TaxID=34485 RepID=A0ACC2RJQ7_9FUNG|nr:hypothetical protein DSO57_1016060 [Entomophthora muscae]